METKRNKIRPAKPVGSISASVVRIGNNAHVNRKRWINIRIHRGGASDTQMARAA